MDKAQQILKDFSLDVDSLNPYDADEEIENSDGVKSLRPDARHEMWKEMATLVVSMIQDRLRAEEMKPLKEIEDVEQKLAEESVE